MLPFGYTLESIAISYLLLYLVTKPQSIGGRVLNAKPLLHVGLISYSLYLWQQLFFNVSIEYINLGQIPFQPARRLPCSGTILASSLTARAKASPQIQTSKIAKTRIGTRSTHSLAS